MINYAINLGGTYYLPMPLYACKHMLKKAYPQIVSFFNKKLIYDKDELFINSFYKKYAPNIHS